LWELAAKASDVEAISKAAARVDNVFTVIVTSMFIPLNDGKTRAARHWFLGVLASIFRRLILESRAACRLFTRQPPV
jgi:hypothetical protein